MWPESSVPRGKYWRSSPLVFSLLPRCHGTLRVAEVDLHAGVDGELDVFGHLFALVPGDRTAQLDRKLEDLFGQGFAHRFAAVTVGEPHQHDVTAGALHQGADGAHRLCP